MELKLKSISWSAIPEALNKAHLYRCMREPEEAESICHDILAIAPEEQLALRMLGLAIIDQFTGQDSDRYAEVASIFQRLSAPYEREYYMGLMLERRAKAQMRAGAAPHSLLNLLQEAMRYFERAEKIHPPNNDDAVLRWNRCVRLLQTLPQAVEATVAFEDHDDAPLETARRRSA